MNYELREKIKDKLTNIYHRTYITDESMIMHKVNKKFKELDTTEPEIIETICGEQLIGKPLFVAVNDDDVKRNVLKRNGVTYVKKQEIQIVLFVTETNAHLMIETQDWLRPISTTDVSEIIENKTWQKVNIEDVDAVYKKHGLFLM